MIEKIESKGMLIHQLPIKEDTTAKDVVVSLTNGIQLSRDRWLITCHTRSWRGIDDDLGVLYQLREDTPDGPVMREGILAETIEEWDALGDGRLFIRQCFHAAPFGVPKGAVVNGKPALNTNVFAVGWHVSARVFDEEKNRLLWDVETPQDAAYIEWMQFRLNEAEDDIEILQPAQRMRQKGYEKGAAFCELGAPPRMNSPFVQPVPVNSDRTEWVQVAAFDGWVAPIKFAWNTETGLYEWVKTGPYLNHREEVSLTEGIIAPYGDEWVMAARLRKPGIAWFRTKDPFGPRPEMVISEEIKTGVPRTAYMCPDGVLRVFTTDESRTPYTYLENSARIMTRCPLYMWDIDPERNFAASAPRVVFDSVKEGVPFEYHNGHVNHFCKLLPHSGGRHGLLMYFLRTNSLYHTGRSAKSPVTAEEIANSGIYHSKITYDKEYPGMWEFA